MYISGKNVKKIVVLSGAGMSAESGIQTFRGGDGLWRKYRFEDLASPEAWDRNPALVQEFYNGRRKIVFDAQPNAGHKALVRLEKKFDVQIITQNVDDLHERAGSSKIMHLHGEIKKARSTGDPNLIYTLEKPELKMGDTCEKGFQLRPHIVWFGEAVPMMEPAMQEAALADIFIVIGTSMLVYPAASLIHYVDPEKPQFYVDPDANPIAGRKNLVIIREKATVGVPQLVKQLLHEG